MANQRGTTKFPSAAKTFEHPLDVVVGFPLVLCKLQCGGRNFDFSTMPVRVELDPPPPANSTQPGINTSLLYSGSKFQGHQKSKGNCYDVEVVLQVISDYVQFCALRIELGHFYVCQINILLQLIVDSS